MIQIKRTFVPGSEWLYLKIYAGNKTLDNILSQDIFFIVNKLKDSKLIEKWFFIRYADPDSHVRIRFLVNDIISIGQIIDLIYKRLDKLVKSNIVWKIQLDTYNRELERYGANLINESESIFWKDSECILHVIRLIKKSQNENYRWMIALHLIDSFLSDFSFSLSQKQQLIEKISQSFMGEFGFNKFNSKQFNSKFRDKKKIIESVLGKNVEDVEFSVFYKPIKERSKNLTFIIQQIETKIKKSKTYSLEDLLTSYIHMTMNRLFMARNREHELVLYDFMRRYYTSKIAKSKYTKEK